MCRMYAHISKEPAQAADLLLNSRKSLLRLSAVPGREQSDGWGLGSFAWLRSKRAGTAIKIVKSSGALAAEAPRFLATAESLKASILIAHVRAASNPRGLPKSKLKGRLNSEPFSDGKILFAHHGMLTMPDAVLKRLGPLRRNVRGVNDSEVFFWQFMKFFRTHKDVARALRACCAELREIWLEGRPDKRPKDPHAGLNALISDGEKVYAFCHYPGTDKALLSDRPWGRMVYGRRGGRLVIASEPMDSGRWHDLRDGELLEAGASGAVRKRRLKLAC